MPEEAMPAASVATPSESATAMPAASPSATIEAVPYGPVADAQSINPADVRVQNAIENFYKQNPDVHELPTDLQNSLDSYHHTRQETQAVIQEGEAMVAAAKQQSAEKVAITQQEVNAEREQFSQQISEWKEKEFAETAKKKEAGWTKEDFLRERMEQGERTYDPNTVQTRTVEEYRAIKEENATKPRILPRPAEEIPHNTMRVAENPIILADVDGPGEAENMIKYAKSQGMDCLCQLPNGVMLLGGDSPAMKNTASAIGQSSIGKHMLYSENLEMTLMHGASPQVLFNLFCQQYQADCIAMRDAQMPNHTDQIVENETPERMSEDISDAAFDR